MKRYNGMREVVIRYRKIVVILLTGMAVGAGILGWAYYEVGASAKSSMYTSPNLCPDNEIAILFGCGKYVSGGRINLYYLYRIRAAVDLYKAGKVQHILVSGDNHISSYNEPESMQQDLMLEGVPESAITLDYAGFSTFETLIRANKIFGVRSATLITQHFHLPRALYIARNHGIRAVGYAAQEPYRSLQTTKTEVREILARFATFGDLHIWHRKPRFLGKREYIDVTVSRHRSLRSNCG